MHAGQADAVARGEGVAAGAVDAEQGDDLAGQAMNFLEFAKSRRPGRPLIRVFNPTAKSDGWASEQTAIEIDQEVRRLVTEQYEVAKTLLEENLDLLARMWGGDTQAESSKADDLAASDLEADAVDEGVAVDTDLDAVDAEERGDGDGGGGGQCRG